MTEDMLLEMVSSGDKCVNSCNIINSSTCQLLTSVTNIGDTEEGWMVDDHGCYDLALLLPSSMTHKNYVNVRIMQKTFCETSN